jgi:hypothetical protein
MFNGVGADAGSIVISVLEYPSTVHALAYLPLLRGPLSSLETTSIFIG